MSGHQESIQRSPMSEWVKSHDRSPYWLPTLPQQDFLTFLQVPKLCLFDLRKSDMAPSFLLRLKISFLCSLSYQPSPLTWGQNRPRIDLVLITLSGQHFQCGLFKLSNQQLWLVLVQTDNQLILLLSVH